MRDVLHNAEGFAEQTTGMRTDDAALQVMHERQKTHIWYGDPDALHEIAERAGYKSAHPLNVLATVMSQLSRSEKFRLVGQLAHKGRGYPVFVKKQHVIPRLT